MPLVHIHGVQNSAAYFLFRRVPQIHTLLAPPCRGTSCRHVHVYHLHMQVSDAMHKRKRAGAMSLLVSLQQSRRGQLRARLMLQSCADGWRRLSMRRVCWRSR